MPAELHIKDEWKGPLVAAGLDTFDAVMGSEQGKCASWHTRGQTYRIEMPGGEVVFLKRDTYTSAKDILTDLVNLRRPLAPCINEMHALRLVADLGIPVPEVIAWGRRGWASLPRQAAIIMTELPGAAMSEFLKTDHPSESRRIVMSAAGAVAAKLFRAGLCWPDMVPKHFIIDGDTVGILDLARMRKTARPVERFMPKQVRRFSDRLNKRGGNADDLKNFLDALTI
ncbi:MAG: phosphotransferase [Phycisphaerae bacterium]|nr:phosphotransferase [Phycisphaerae bacterium]